MDTLEGAAGARALRRQTHSGGIVVLRHDASHPRTNDIEQQRIGLGHDLVSGDQSGQGQYILLTRLHWHIKTVYQDPLTALQKLRATTDRQPEDEQQK